MHWPGARQGRAGARYKCAGHALSTSVKLWETFRGMMAAVSHNGRQVWDTEEGWECAFENVSEINKNSWQQRGSLVISLI